MKAFLGSVVLLVAITGIAAIVLGTIDMSSQTVYSTTSTSLR